MLKSRKSTETKVPTTINVSGESMSRVYSMYIFGSEAPDEQEIVDLL